MADFDMSKTPKAEPRIVEIQVRDYDLGLPNDMQSVLDDALRGTGAFTMNDPHSGHVELIDGDIDTADMANDIITGLQQLGWIFHRSGPWTIVTEEQP